MNPTPAIPRFLLGAALLFWSVMTGQWLLGITLAVVVELARWVPLRWDFGEQAFLRAWHLSVLLVAARMVLTVLEGTRAEMIPRLVEWAPALMFPVQFAQSYGLRNKMPLHVFSILARRRWQRNRKLGVAGEPASVDFGYVFLVLTLLAATLGKTAESPPPIWVFLAGLIVTLGWALLALRRGRAIAVVLCLMLAGAMGLGGMIGLKSLYRWATHGRYSSGDDGTNLNHYQTSIGKLGEIKQSRKVLWRMKTLQGPTPVLLRTTLYNQYERGAWVCRQAKEISVVDTAFDYLQSAEKSDGRVYYFAAGDRSERAMADDLPRVELRGTVKLNMALPVPGTLTSLTKFDFDKVERNRLGTIRFDPKEPILGGEILWSPDASPDGEPWSVRPPSGTFVSDLKIPQDERAAVREVAEELGLDAMTVPERIETIRDFFREEFRYTRYLSIPPLSRNSESSRSAISQFLTTTRAGHCEYFATAATLLLREAGVPTRYATGYAVLETDVTRRESVIRGTHAHAWCRVWDDDARRWFDFDPTPPDWLAAEPDRSTWDEAFTEWIQRIREDFFIWRNEPDNSVLAGIAMSITGLLGAGAIARSLWKSRQRVDRPGSGKKDRTPARRTPLHELEPLAKRWLGPRPTGMPYGRWLLGLRDMLPERDTLQEAVTLHQQRRFDPDADHSPDDRLAALADRLRGFLKTRWPRS